MIEIMCRDGTVSDAALCKLALELGKITKQDVNPLTSTEARAVVFWGIEDIENLAKEYFGGTDVECEEVIEDFLDYAEQAVYETTLSAGWDCLRDLLGEYLDAFDGYGDSPPPDDKDAPEDGVEE